MKPIRHVVVLSRLKIHSLRFVNNRIAVRYILGERCVHVLLQTLIASRKKGMNAGGTGTRVRFHYTPRFLGFASRI